MYYYDRHYGHEETERPTRRGTKRYRDKDAPKRALYVYHIICFLFLLIFIRYKSKLFAHQILFFFFFISSAFFYFCQELRGKMRELHPEMGVGDIAKELGKLWMTTDLQTKSKYMAIAEEDRVRYERVSNILLV